MLTRVEIPCCGKSGENCSSDTFQDYPPYRHVQDLDGYTSLTPGNAIPSQQEFLQIDPEIADQDWIIFLEIAGSINLFVSYIKLFLILLPVAVSAVTQAFAM